MQYDPANDGVTHINIYSKGKTLLGRWLSNFTYAPFDLTDDGHFASIEGYWYWLSTGKKDDQLRYLWGYKAKNYGRSLRGADWVETPEFQAKLCKALELKLRSNPEWLEVFAASVLPFEHYYLMYGKVTQPTKGRWILDFWSNLREQLNYVRKDT